MTTEEDTYDAIVVGAGFAGLTAARRLIDAGRRVLVLEARGRVGGRVHTHHIDAETYVDLGGQWIGPTQDRIRALAAEMGVSAFRTYNEGENIIALGGRVRRYRGLIPRLDPLSLLNIDFVIRRLERLARRVDPERPWASPGAYRLDGATLATFLDRAVWFRDARRVLEAGLETVFAATPAEVSLLHALFYIRSGTSLNTLLSIDEGAQQDRFAGGAQVVADRLADRFRAHIRLDTPVRQVVQSAAGVEVRGEGFAGRARRLIIAVPPPLAARIDCRPALPANRDQLLQRLPMGAVIKCYAIFDRPWWREQGLSGQVVADDHYWLQTVFDNSPADGSRGMLMGFALANRARRLLEVDPHQRRALVLDTFGRFFGAEATQPRFYIDKSWADEEWSRGCYAGLMAPGAWTGFTDTLRRPCGRIHWAGTETAAIWNGYIDGAIRSGERAAREVLNALS